jgi:hypothetical protein
MTTQQSLAERPERPPWRGGLVGPVILIALGIVFLLNNLGYLDWDIWDALLRLWPVLLIAIGLDLLIGRRSALGSALLVLLVVGGVGAAIWWMGLWLPSSAAIATETISQPLNGARSATIDIDMGAGQLQVGALSESDNLVEGTVVPGGGQVLRDFSLDSDRATFKLRSQGSWGFPFGQRRSARMEWNVMFNRDIPLRLSIDTGAGQAKLDLARLQLSALDINLGVGQTHLTLPERGQLQAHINGGVGETTVIVPAGMAARIEATAGLGQLQVLGNFERAGKLWISPGYDNASNRVELVVNGGIGQVTIRQESGR